MKLGVKALNPRYISEKEPVSDYYGMGFQHFDRSCKELNLDKSEISRKGEIAKNKLKEGNELNPEEEEIVGLILEGDRWWSKAIINWQSLHYRIGLYIPEIVFRYKFTSIMNKYVDKKVPMIQYASPESFKSPEAARNQIVSPLVLHIDWFDYLLRNMEIENDIDLKKVKQETVKFFLEQESLSESTVEIQKILTKNDLRWIKDLRNYFDYNAFFFDRAENNLKNFLKEVGEKP